MQQNTYDYIYDEDDFGYDDDIEITNAVIGKVMQDISKGKNKLRKFKEDNNKKEEIKENTQVARVEIKNGTWINGLANKTSIDLEKNNFIYDHFYLII